MGVLIWFSWWSQTRGGLSMLVRFGARLRCLVMLVMLVRFGAQLRCLVMLVMLVRFGVQLRCLVTLVMLVRFGMIFVKWDWLL